jgi:hypothetical protein
MWGSRYFTARYWTARFFSATGSSLPPSDDLYSGVLSAISDVGNGVIGFRGALENGLLSAIVIESGMISPITTDNESYSPINDEGNGLESLIS